MHATAARSALHRLVHVAALAAQNDAQEVAGGQREPASAHATQHQVQRVPGRWQQARPAALERLRV